MRPESSRDAGPRGPAHLVLSVGLAFAASLPAGSARGGLLFRPVPSLEGADVTSLATDGTSVWAATARGVWVLSAGAWHQDGLGDLTATSVAFSQGTAWAAAGDGLYRRAGPGSWTREALPAPSARVAVLLAEGDVLWAAGGGVFRRAGGSWTALPSYGPGFVTALGAWNGGLAAGVTIGGAVFWNGVSWEAMWSGLGAGEAPASFAVDGGTLLCGIYRGLFAWSGTAWVQDASLGARDVHGLSTSGGTLLAATADAGVLRRSAGEWTRENAGLVGAGARSFVSRGADLLVATAGGPVHRWSGASWLKEGTGLNAAVISSLSFSPALDCFAPAGGMGVAGSGSGFGFLPAPADGACTVVPTGLVLPDGCGDASSASLSPVPPIPAYVAAVSTNCGVWMARTTSGRFESSGLAPRVAVEPLERTPNGLAGGTADAGAFLFTGSGWSPLGTALPGAASVSTLRQVGTTLWAGTSQGIHRMEPGQSAWIETNTGIPEGRTAIALAGADPLFAGFLAGGVYRRDGTAPWKEDVFGLQGLAVFGLASSRGSLWAAAGTAGVAAKSEGGWRAERSGLPMGANVRVLEAWSVVEGAPATAGSSTTSRLLFAGTAGHGLFAASTASGVKSLPVVLDVGGEALRYRTEMTVGNRGPQERTVRMTFVPAPRFSKPSGPVPEVVRTIPGGGELRISDAIEFLRSEGVPLPVPGPSDPIAGSLSISSDTPRTTGAATDDLYAVARTYAGTTGAGTFGLYYAAASDLEGAEDEATVYGLRSVPGVSRSNLAAVHFPGRGGTLELEVQVYAADGTPSPAPLSMTLGPGEWSQFNGILETAGLPAGSYGYARIRRVSGSGTWSAYGVVNDQRTNDGSFLPAYRPGGLAAARRLVVPVVLDVVGAAGVPHYTTELTIANRTPVSTPVDLAYNPAPDFGSAPGAPFVTLTLAPGEQRTVPDAIQFLRDNGVRIPDPATSGPQGGSLYVDFRYLQSVAPGDTVALARTSTPNPDASVGGSFGTFYPAVARGGGARTRSLVAGLTRDANVRANLAVVHLGGGSSLPMTLSVQLFDAATGRAAGNPLTVTLNPGDWWQWSGVADQAALPPGMTRFTAVVSRTAGDDTFLAYGVMNDMVTSDGSYLAGFPEEAW